jgi:uncharacterized membrane protein YphA (DoxX/SURF4 family)
MLRALKPITLSLSEVLIGSLLLIVGVAKLYDLQGFHDTLVNLPMLSGTTAGLVTVLIPNIEVTLGICLVLGSHTELIRAATCALALLFTVVALYWLAHGMRTACGCVGSVNLSPEEPVLIFGRNLILALVTGIIYYFRRTEVRPLAQPPDQRRFQPEN